jgi:hypothetical protein
VKTTEQEVATVISIERQTHGTRHIVRRWLSPTYFALAVLAFFLPFATVSCDSASTTFTGVQLVTHSVPAGGAVDEAPDCSGDIGGCVERTSAGTATFALVAASIGLVLGLFGIGRGPGICAAFGLLAIASLPLDGDTADVSLHSGYLLAIASLLAAGVLHLIRAARGRRAGVAPP